MTRRVRILVATIVVVSLFTFIQPTPLAEAYGTFPRKWWANHGQGRQAFTMYYQIDGRMNSLLNMPANANPDAVQAIQNGVEEWNRVGVAVQVLPDSPVTHCAKRIARSLAQKYGAFPGRI